MTARDRSTRRRDAAIVAVLAVAVAALLVAARADGGGPLHRATDAGAPARPAVAVAAAGLPPGWHQVHRQLTGVIIPVQVFAAATYPIVLHHRAQACGPPRVVLAAMPPDGLLLQVIEYPPRSQEGEPIRVPRLPRRPHRFSWADATWGPYECAGPSYKLEYRQDGRALQAQIWMHRDSVDPALRAGALRILDHLVLP